MLKRKKSRQDDDDDDHDWGKKKKKRKHHHKENKDCSNIKEGSRDSNDPEAEEELTAAMDDLPPEKTLQCQVGLAEINRKLGVVMCQPV